MTKFKGMRVLQTGVTIIDIDTGKTRELTQGRDYDLSYIEFKDRSYHVITDSRWGSATVFFQNCDLHRKIELIIDHGDDCTTWHDVKLPITSASQVPRSLQYGVLAHLIAGVLHCEKCSLHKDLLYPDAITIYPCNIMPYSQDCHVCGQQLVSIGRNQIFPKYVKPEKKRK